jgi:hypothetical protein
MRELIKRNIRGSKVLFLFILTNIVYVIMLTLTIPKVMLYSKGMKPLDLIPTGYSAEYVNTLFSTLGDKGRHAYLYYQLPLDLIYPLLFGISSCLVLAYFLNKLGKLDSNLFFLCTLPLFSGLFDYGENIGIISMLRAYPNNTSLQTQLTSTFSVLKSFSIMIYFIILIITLVAFAKSRLFPKEKLD